MTETFRRCGNCTFPLAHDEPGPYCEPCIEDYALDGPERAGGEG